MEKKKYDYKVSTDNVFADLGLEDSDELLARAQLLNEISSLIKSSGIRQSEIAKILGISQPKVSLLVSGKLSEFSTDSLIQYLSLLGCCIEIRVQKPRTRSGISRRRGTVRARSSLKRAAKNRC